MRNEIAENKQLFRALARQRRMAVANRDALSRTILERAIALDAYECARAAMFYVDVGSEVRTRFALPAALESGKTIVVPWCEEGELRLFHLREVDELAPGRYNILEPRPELRGQAERRLAAEASTWS